MFHQRNQKHNKYRDSQQELTYFTQPNRKLIITWIVLWHTFRSPSAHSAKPTKWTRPYDWNCSGCTQAYFTSSDYSTQDWRTKLQPPHRMLTQKYKTKPTSHKKSRQITRTIDNPTRKIVRLRSHEYDANWNTNLAKRLSGAREKISATKRAASIPSHAHGVWPRCRVSWTSRGTTATWGRWSGDASGRVLRIRTVATWERGGTR